MVLDDPLDHLDYKLDILVAILAAILDSHDRIAKPSSRIVLQPLIIHKKVGLDDFLVHLDYKLNIFPKSRSDGCHLGF